MPSVDALCMNQVDMGERSTRVCVCRRCSGGGVWRHASLEAWYSDSNAEVLSLRTLETKYRRGNVAVLSYETMEDRCGDIGGEGIEE